MSVQQSDKKDVELCKLELKAVLDKYNCFLMDRDESMNLLLVDMDTQETIGFRS